MVNTRYPYFALVGDYCGGSLIAPDIVLTAGHCKLSHHHYQHEIRIGPKSRHYHNNGEDNDRSYDDRHKSIHQVRHPDFERRGDDEFSNDVLIIQLADPSDHPFIHLDKEMIHTSSVLAMGMGWTKKDRPSVSNHLNIVMLDTIENDLCSQTTARNMTYDGRIDDSMMCTTGGPDNERDTWYGQDFGVGLSLLPAQKQDISHWTFIITATMAVAGSPIIILGRTPQQDRLLGIVSWGTPTFQHFSFEWIQATTCSLSRYPPVVYVCGNSAGGNFFVQHEWWRWNIGAVVPGVLFYVVRQWWRHCDGDSGKSHHHSYSEYCAITYCGLMSFIGRVLSTMIPAMRVTILENRNKYYISGNDDMMIQSVWRIASLVIIAKNALN